jgi:hypothetical protein
MRLFKICIAALALCVAPAPAFAAPAEVNHAIPNAQQVGAARYHMLTMSLFDATLYNASGDFSWTQPFALSITYQRGFSSRALTNRGLQEMRQRGGGTSAQLEALRAPLLACMPDVRPGDRVTGVATGPNTARFYFNGRQRCEIEWPGFKRSFFGIWLAGRDGPAAQFSAQLRGEA